MIFTSARIANLVEPPLQPDPSSGLCSKVGPLAGAALHRDRAEARGLPRHPVQQNQRCLCQQPPPTKPNLKAAA